MAKYYFVDKKVAKRVYNNIQIKYILKYSKKTFLKSIYIYRGKLFILLCYAKVLLKNHYVINLVDRLAVKE